MSPDQLETAMKRKQARKKVMNGFAPAPPIPVAKLVRPSSANSTAFCTAPGTSLSRRARIVNDTMITAITIQLMMIEPVMLG